ncbi:unnamed protein product [Adineta steineri]|uniref:Uncharacterized protein n=1 Tax=Adineta steineri TaxID=433720 RepID=A0A815VIE5_9BILA|nr:unnamed protein product [Adineta steineri]CAF1529326.1 unnamed protein product [Adineta steineri]CAF1653031.1 unnamed protein product [Adineta steineri]CAF1653039.1 unnamed protein product [Adineta steineri]
MQFYRLLFVFALLTLAIGLAIGDREIRHDGCDNQCKPHGDVTSCCQKPLPLGFSHGICKGKEAYCIKQ